MNPSIKEMVDAAVAELGRKSEPINDHLWYVDPEKIKTALLSITEKVVASERARLREAVEGLKKEEMFGQGGEAMHNFGFNAALDAVLALTDKSL